MHPLNTYSILTVNGHQLIHPSQLFESIWMYLDLRAKMSDTVSSCIFQDAPLSHSKQHQDYCICCSWNGVFLQCLLDLKFWRSLWIQVTFDSEPKHRFSGVTNPNAKTLPVQIWSNSNQSFQIRFQVLRKKSAVPKWHGIKKQASLPHTSNSGSPGPFTIQLARWVAVHS